MDALTIIREADWEALADRVEAPLPQRWLYGAAAARIGRDVRRLCVYDSGQPVAMAQVVLRPVFGLTLGLISHGPLFLPSETAPKPRAILRAFRRALPLGVTLMTPRDRLRRLGLSPAPDIVELDLTPPLAALREAMNGKWRNALRKAERDTTPVTHFSPSPATLAPYLRCEKRQQAARRYRGLPPEFALVLQDVAPTSLRLFERHDAFMLFVLHGNTATYHIGHTGPEGRAQNAHNRILWEAITRLKREGVRRLDLGTIDLARAPDLARFKLRTGAHARRLSPAAVL